MLLWHFYGYFKKSFDVVKLLKREFGAKKVSVSFCHIRLKNAYQIYIVKVYREMKAVLMY